MNLIETINLANQMPEIVFSAYNTRHRIYLSVNYDDVGIKVEKRKLLDKPTEFPELINITDIPEDVSFDIDCDETERSIELVTLLDEPALPSEQKQILREYLGLNRYEPDYLYESKKRAEVALCLQK